MSTQHATFSVLTSDIHRRPHLLGGLQLEAAARINFQGEVTTVENGAVTTVTAVMA